MTPLTNYDLCVQKVWSENKNGTGAMTTARNFYWVITWKLLFSWGIKIWLGESTGGNFVGAGGNEQIISCWRTLAILPSPSKGNTALCVNVFIYVYGSTSFSLICGAQVFSSSKISMACFQWNLLDNTIKF